MPAILDLPAEQALEFELAAIVSAEQLIRRLHADRYRAVQRARALATEVAGITESSRAGDRNMATRSFVAELATTLGQHEASASRLVAEAERLTGPRIATLDALDAGEVAPTQVRSVLELTRGAPAEVADAVERVALDAAGAAVADGVVSTNADVRRRMRRVRERLMPEPLVDRRARAAADRRVCVEAAPDGMAWLSLFLEAERAFAIERRLDVLASREASDDHRTGAQRATDLAADLLLSGTLVDDPRTRDVVTGPTGAVQPRLNVTVPVLTLLGLDDEPADLEGYGPIDAETARIIAAHAPSMRRILVHPETGATLSYGREHYRAPADLDGFVRVRDGQCRFPGCNRRAERADLDHTRAWAHGGKTCSANLAVLCRHHHRLKHEAGWRVALEANGIMRWTSPAGHVLRTTPERRFEPVGAGEGVHPPDPPEPTDPPAPGASVDAEVLELLDSDLEPAPF
ncbi:HNH endonuclease signature motif containing protein [Agromyces bracchium]|uniref:DUF222 domain-containing protein n=1 Tax=Agromyces bracchium TaxID=88376 RepID=A0A6I3M6S4_9MICO|nr:HNH endonuclease signature motif containing protein [Agromyces bracchium]MTH68661.1 DUF222 domain-containing protein [Agromyces bracchium]